MTTFSSAETKNRQQQQKITVIAMMMMMMMMLSVFVDGGSHGVTIVARHVH